MFLRCKVRRKDGKQHRYWSVVENCSWISSGRSGWGRVAKERVAAGNDALTAAVRERQDLTGRWQRLDADIIKAASRAPAERNPTQEQGLHAALQETARQLDAL